MSFRFEIEATDGKARAGRMVTPHGEVQTRAFMPVGTLGGHEPARPGGGDDRRVGHRWRRLSDLSRTGAGSQVASGQRGGGGQSVGPQRVDRSPSELLYLPLYSPDFHPIEKGRSKLKQLLHAAKARGGGLGRAITEALKAIIAEKRRRLFSPLRACITELAKFL